MNHLTLTRFRPGRDWLCVLLCASLAAPGRAVESAALNFGDMTIEQLMNESVTSVSKKATTLADSPAAVAVVTADDIRRLGATSIAEALRFVPGLDVARMSASQWAISSRGFNYPYENKLLVLMDGRSVYTPVFGGVYWDATDTAMQDIDRIEVVRGPGATLWGANAVNGVINIITKSAKETQGTLISTEAGTLDGIAGTVRHGGRLGENYFYRAYVKSFSRQATVDPTGAGARDEWNEVQAGFRIDGDASPADTLMLEGNYSTGQTHEHVQSLFFAPPFATEEVVAGRDDSTDLLGRWVHRFAASELTVQGYFDHSLHSDGNTNPRATDADLDVQHRFTDGRRHDVVWGFSYRRHTDDIPPSSLVTWTPDRRTTQLATAFAQDQIGILPGRLSLILGSKFEYDFASNVRVQPGVRLLWTPSATETVWAGVSRAFKTPARFDTDARLNTPAFQPPGGPLMQVALVGDPAVRVEELRAYEIGYRVRPTASLSFDFAAFANDYDDLISYTPGAPEFEPTPAPGHLLIPLVGGNRQNGNTYGAEIAVQWRVNDRWRLAADYTWLQAKIRPDPSVEGDSPKHQVHVRSYLELSDAWELNAAAAYVGPLTNSNSYNHIPGYVRLDLGLVWHPTPGFEAGLWGQNLLDARHPEFTQINTTFRNEIPRSVSGRITWRF